LGLERIDKLIGQQDLFARFHHYLRNFFEKTLSKLELIPDFKKSLPLKA
jgi:hypothetical protein